MGNGFITKERSERNVGTQSSFVDRFDVGNPSHSTVKNDTHILGRITSLDSVGIH